MKSIYIQIQQNVMLLLNVPSRANVETLEVCGKILGSTFVSNGGTISLSNYKPGIYFFRISTDQNTSLHRIIKN